MKINADFRSFAAANFDASLYVASPSYGVNRFMLDRIGEEKARATTIVEYRPNSRFPNHEHIGGEEFLVLEGTFKDQYGAFSAGHYVRNPIGSEHAPWVDGDGCTIMVKLLQMAEEMAVGEGSTAPLHVNYDNNKELRRIPTEYGTVLDLYQNEYTGEHVQMCWIDGDTLFPVEEECLGGEELFVVEGSLLLVNDDDNNNGKEEEYRKWGWLRFPAAAEADEVQQSDGDQQQRQQHRVLRAGQQGAQVYRKMAHLTKKALSLEKIRIAEDETIIES